jgi:hypothetical protein
MSQFGQMLSPARGTKRLKLGHSFSVVHLEIPVDIRYFLECRIAFVRQFYTTASEPYVERKRKIEAHEAPFVPLYSEDAEPPFLDEWLEADESLHILAYSCVSMLSTALHLYLESWVKQSRVAVEESMKKSVFKKKGWFLGYDAHFTKHFNIAFKTGPSDLKMLNEVVLVRNRIEHPYSITDRKTQYCASDLKQLRHPFFVDKTEMALLGYSEEENESRFILPTVHITEAQLLAAVAEVERFSAWFDPAISAVVYGH